MSGHSKWSTIKHRKEAQDAKRGKVFIKIVREIIVATRTGGGDPETNPRLRAVLQSARTANMPKENVKRAIDRGLGGSDAEQFYEIQYEGYATHGVAIIAQALTDNKNRTAAAVRSIFNKNGGNLGESGSVAYLFDTTGCISFDGTRYNEEQILQAALEAGAEDVQSDGDDVVVFCNPKEFHKCTEAFMSRNLEYSHADILKLPKSPVVLSEEESAKITKLIESLEDLDDIQKVYSNLS